MSVGNRKREKRKRGEIEGEGMKKGEATWGVNVSADQ